MRNIVWIYLKSINFMRSKWSLKQQKEQNNGNTKFIAHKWQQLLSMHMLLIHALASM